MLRIYDRTLQWTLRPPADHDGGRCSLTFVLTAYLFVVIPKGFIPTEDNGTIFAFTEAAQDISFDAMMAKQRAVADDRPAASPTSSSSCRSSAPAAPARS